MDDRYIDPAELETIRSAIESRGFQPDPLVAEHADRPHIGLNLAMAWPLPASLESAYEAFRTQASALDPGVYVYAFETTHVTVLTAVNFKPHPDPSDDTVRAVERAADELGEWLEEAMNDFPPFTLEFGRPVLTCAAAFVPMHNATGEIARMRSRALAFCRASAGILAAASAPRMIHSTVLRFAAPPRDARAFAEAFDAVARDVSFEPVTIDHVLVTLETKPYMRAGRVTRSVELSATR